MTRKLEELLGLPRLDDAIKELENLSPEEEKAFLLRAVWGWHRLGPEHEMDHTRIQAILKVINEWEPQGGG